MSFSVDLYDEPCPTCHRGGLVWSWDGMTYNLAPMFHLAGFYERLKGETGGTGTMGEVCLRQGVESLELPPPTGAELEPLLRKGLEDMKTNPDKYKKLNPENKWGDFKGAQAFTKALLDACTEYPNAIVKFSG